MESRDLFNQPWFAYLEKEQQELIRTALTLIEKKDKIADLSDYSFIVFEMAKAYEGFLKKYFLQFGLISKRTYQSKRFRIGRALNPDVRPQHRDEDWIFDDVVKKCSRELANELWNTWLQCRNRVFHYFPGGTQTTLSFSEAEKKVEIVVQAMKNAMTCLLSKSS